MLSFSLSRLILVSAFRETSTGVLPICSPTTEAFSNIGFKLRLPALPEIPASKLMERTTPTSDF